MDAQDDAPASQKISDRAVLTGVKIEFDRTLPFWRCCTDLQHRFGRKPVMMDRETVLQSRIPCDVFKGVDVVWAVTTVTLNVQTASVPKKTAATPSDDSESSVSAGRKRSADEMSSDERTATRMRVAERKKLSRFWRDVPHETHVYHLGTMHFVHDDAHVRGSIGAARSFHIQSVVLYEEPALLQCVAGTMVVFALLIYASNALLNAGRGQTAGETEGDTEDSQAPVTRQRERQWVQAGLEQLSLPDHGSPPPTSPEQSPCYALDRLRANSATARAADILLPPADSRVLILGMGGNSMGLALRALLGARVELHVVEVEPAVVKACETAGTLKRDDPHLFVHAMDAHEALAQLAGASFDMVFMDLFEPLKGSMDNEASLVSLAASKLRPGGLLVVNDHCLPTAKGLAPLTAHFGHGNVQAVNLHGWKESVILCVQPGSAANDGLGNVTSRWTMNTVFDVYEQLAPGLLPPPSWLQKSVNVGAQTARARIWTS